MNTTTTVTQTNGRFAGLVGQKYGRLLASMPHYIAIQELVATAAQQALSKKAGLSSEILDLGCGTGLTTLALCEKVSNTTILGVDSEQVMINQYEEVTREQKSSIQSKGIVINLVVQDGLEFLKDCATESFDVVVSGFMVHNLTKELRQQILIEIKRVLRPGGRFVNGDKIAQDDEEVHQRCMYAQIATFVRSYSGPEDIAYCLGWIEHYVQDDRKGTRMTESEVRQSLSQAGFGKVEICGRHGMEAVVIADV